MEVFREGKAKHCAEADCHIGIARKIIINLQCIIQRAEPGQRCADSGRSQPKNFIGTGGKTVCQNYLFRHTVKKTLDPVGKVLYSDTAILQLRFYLRITDNRAGDQLREKADIQCHQEPAFLQLRFAAIQINHIAHCLKGIKADAKRQRNIPNRQDLPPKQSGKRIPRERIVLEISQQRQIGQYDYSQS